MLTAIIRIIIIPITHTKLLQKGTKSNLAIVAASIVTLRRFNKMTIS